MGLYKANAVLFFRDVPYQVCVKKKDERNLDTKSSGLYGQRFRLICNCVTPKKFSLDIEAPVRGLMIIDPVETDLNLVTIDSEANMKGEFILDEDHRTRWKSTECYLGQKFEGYFMARRQTDTIEDGNGNTVEANEDDWN